MIIDISGGRGAIVLIWYVCMGSPVIIVFQKVKTNNYAKKLGIFN